MNEKILKDSFLVAGGLSLKGGIHYKITDRKKQIVDGKEIIEYEGERTIDKPDEYSKAKAFRNKMWRLLLYDPENKEHICANTMVGLICPIDKEERFDKVAKNITSEIAKFTEKEKLDSCDLFFTPVKFLISADNITAYKAVAQGIIKILEDLKSALNDNEFKRIRHILGSTRGIIPILTKEPRDILQAAFDSCRAQANRIAQHTRDIVDSKQKKATKINVDTSKIETAIKEFSTI